MITQTDESATKVDLPEAPAQNAQGQAVVAPGVIPNMYPPMGYHAYNPIPVPIVGQAYGYPFVQPVLPPQPTHVPAWPPQQRQFFQPPRPTPNTRTRVAIAEEQQRQAQLKRHAAADAKAERALMAEQVRIAEEENRTRQRLDSVRDEEAVARREQQERAWSAMELERQRQRGRRR